MGKVIKTLSVLTALLIGTVIVYESVKITIRKQSDGEELQSPSPSQVELVEPTPIYGKAKASWYGKAICQGREFCRTASGEIFNEEENTFAHRTMAFGTRVEFCYNDVCVVGRCTDRGPFIDGRDFDFSYGLFNRLANPNKGVIEIKWRIIE